MVQNLNNNHNSATLKYLITAVLFTAAAVFFDQLSKYICVLFLKDKDPVILIDGVFELRYLENRGAAFGIFQNRQILLIAGALLITIAVICIYIRIPALKKYIPLRICSVLLCAGALGNMIDRIRIGYVIDFFYFSLIDFPIFNVADCYVVISCILFALLILFYYKDEHDFDFISINQKR